ncbi:SIS domain-containing protein [Ferroplasma acidiphilum]|jgi:glucosamine--fructose-6-phosphate aminotransferase (isomerizing)|uniref:Isomerizing glucosamine--fructose-6-phosphate aminotransferase n=1 Tax=Ferroplasma acidiphilum TaxID=74969 RepID=A0A1V0N5D2_9ARCH|nr:SIS domain-containing protein [Ferroplasma acidiphilum]ARD85314.1 isomerizing glucosamine--fructose-6-phosphate aminotransferase [Ferroplasma acidiphilum]MCL4349003.1 SIS domain-containing protein [Candidatus Thermoplasmatota archaeon]
MTDTIPEKRNGHPYYMYDMIRETPESLEITRKTMENTDYSFLSSKPLLFTGNGTAYHAAQIGAGFLYKTDLKYAFVQSYELLNYYVPVHGTVVGISNSGKTKSTIDSLIYQKKFSYIVGITHYHGTPMELISNKSIVIDADDKSLCNTKSFFDNAIASMYIASRYAGIDMDIDNTIETLKGLVASLDSTVKKIAHNLSYVNRIFVLGAGPEEPVAREAAQKIKEATHIHAEGIELEEFIHGCTSLIDDKSLLIIINSNTVNSRTDDIVRACKVVGTKTVVINGDGDYSIDLPDLGDEYINALLNVLPLYYLAYYMAVEQNVNPDLLRFDEETYRKFDDIVFPPGAH